MGNGEFLIVRDKGLYSEISISDALFHGRLKKFTLPDLIRPMGRPKGLHDWKCQNPRCPIDRAVSIPTGPVVLLTKQALRGGTMILLRAARTKQPWFIKLLRMLSLMVLTPYLQFPLQLPKEKIDRTIHHDKRVIGRCRFSRRRDNKPSPDRSRPAEGM